MGILAHFLPMREPFGIFFRAQFLPKNIASALFAACAFSLFIYLYHFGVRLDFIYSPLALLALYLFLRLSPHAGLFFGFFVGIAWFYWIALSFRYYHFAYLIPLVIVGIGLVYGLIFLFLLAFRAPIMRALWLLLCSFIAPFGFDWLVPEIMLLPSHFSTSKSAFALVLFALLLFIYLPKRFMRFLALLPLFFALHTPKNPPIPLPDILLVETQLPQGVRWDKARRSVVISENLAEINRAILEGRHAILFPETAFPLALNLEPALLEILLQKSEQIAIITGALRVEGGRVFNSTYLFSQGKMQHADKIVLVPFGERIPLPRFLADPLNKLFFGGAEGYESGGSEPSSFEIAGEKFRNAICYEATSDKIYKNYPKFMLAGSNNAWFYPSIEPSLQRLLMGYYAQKYGTTIFHSANYSKSEVITPY
ncbi:MAG: apolipoprotein N-acyltransferase [Wolinella sp.]